MGKDCISSRILNFLFIKDGKFNDDVTTTEWIAFAGRVIDVMVKYDLTLEDVKSIVGIASMVLNLKP